MPDILIRNVSPDVITVLKRRAAENGTSMQAEAKRVLEGSIKYTWAEWIAAAEEFSKHVKPSDKSAADIIREEREARMERIERAAKGEE